MEKESLLSNARWNMLKEVAKGSVSATEIAKAARTSLPNVSQQLRLLEAYDFVQRGTEKKGTGRKPQHTFQLKKPFFMLTTARHGFAEKQFTHPNAFQSLLVNVLFLPADDQPFIVKGLLENEQLLNECNIAHVKTTTDGIELLFVTDNVEEVRKKFSSIQVEYLGKKKKLIAWTHSLSEITEGLEKSDKHFEHLAKNPRILHDPKNELTQVCQ